MAAITVRSLQNVRQEVTAPPHALITDEPQEYDGDDLGPNPYEMLLGALGSCTNMTLLGYARRKGWDLRAIETRLTYGREYGEDCINCEVEEAYLEVAGREITLRGDLTADQVEILTRVAKKCPVHKTLAKKMEVRDEVRAEA